MTQYLRELRVQDAPLTSGEKLPTKPQLTTPKAVAEYLMPLLVNKPSEVLGLGVLCLDIMHRVITWTVAARGRLAQCIVEPRNVKCFRDIGSALDRPLTEFRQKHCD